ncbi:hypothetical protein HYT24_01645 [Candidatus Pacearchaeota archaeon]|nr:hypothetical protein [Candidatus Pacearchaeota archaeon]
MDKPFPRKEIYVHTLPNILTSGQVSAIDHGRLELNEELRRYADAKWEKENQKDPNSVIPSAFMVETDENSMTVHCHGTEYKYLLGTVKMAREEGTSDLPQLISDLSSEIMLLTKDEMFVLERRLGEATQVGIRRYDIPSYQNAQIWVDSIMPGERDQIDLNDGMWDMPGFARWSLMREFGLRSKEIGQIFYTGFARGFEVSISPQFNGFARTNLTGEELMARKVDGDRLIYRFEELTELFASLGKEFKRRDLKPDVYGRIPRTTHDGFRIIDGCLGNLLSNAYHLNGIERYTQLKAILKEKGYVIHEVPTGNVNLDDLN